MTETDDFGILLTRAAVDAPRLHFPDNPWVGIPIGLMYLDSALKLAGGFRPKILDAMAYPDFARIRRKDSDGRFGLTDAEFLREVRVFKPKLICFTVVAGRYLPDTIRAIRLIREIDPDVFIIAGGHDVTARPQEYLYSDAGLNAVVVGEGEEAIVALAGALKEGRDWREISGLAFMDDEGRIKKNPSKAIHELDRFVLDFEAIRLEQYFELYRQGFGGRKNISLAGNHRTVFITTSRGCPYPCQFCSIYQTMGRRMRYHSPEYVLELIERLVKRYGVNHVHFEDDHLTADRKRFVAILEGIVARGLKITWDTPNGVRADSFDEELLALCKRSGCIYLMFGVESGDQQVLDKIIRKHLDLKVLERTLATCKKLGIDTMSLYMIGLPGETKAQIRQTTRFAFRMMRKYDTIPFLSLFKPFYDTPLYHTSKEGKFLVDYDKEERRPDIPDMLFTPLMIETPEFTVEHLSATYRRYMVKLGWLATLQWMWITGRRNPWLLAKMLGQFAGLAIRHVKSRNQFDKLTYDFFWGAMIFPKAMLERRKRLQWWLYDRSGPESASG
ncbi:MAG: B12-binding domain-containing radical SAM protein [Bdellovibrionales bacterium]|nr:B12-binding domain-containing radical SAM protein [Bdellovibrionales bacterium]